MIFNEAHAEFAVRYYRWAREQFHSEVQHGFPLLKRLKTRSSRTCLQIMGQLTLDNQLRFAAALVKRFRKEPLETTGETLDAWELEMIKRYTDSILLTRPLYEDRPEIDAAELKVRRKGMATLVKSHLASAFQHKPQNRGGGELCYIIPISGLQVETHLDFGGRSRLVEYSHDIVFSGYNLLVQAASVESWLGLTGATSWSYRDIDESEAEETAQLIAELCALFLGAAPTLVEGLSP